MRAVPVKEGRTDPNIEGEVLSLIRVRDEEALENGAVVPVYLPALGVLAILFDSNFYNCLSPTLLPALTEEHDRGRGAEKALFTPVRLLGDLGVQDETHFLFLRVLQGLLNCAKEKIRRIFWNQGAEVEKNKRNKPNKSVRKAEKEDESELSLLGVKLSWNIALGM